MKPPLWCPSPSLIEKTDLTGFRKYIENAWGVSCPDYQSLYQWSINQPDRFWQSIWSFCDVIAETQGEIVLEGENRMPGARWFPQARLNYAENLLRQRNHDTAIIF